MKRFMIVLLAALLALSLCACGNTLTVDYVSANGEVVGNYYNQTVKLEIDDDLFKDCTLEEQPFIAYDKIYSKFILDSKGDSKMVSAVKGGVTFKVKDKDGNIHPVHIDEGDTFKVTGSDDDMQLILSK